MSTMPPPGYAPGPYYNQPPTRTSGAAITSFVCGLLGCFIITPLLAIIFGFVGISATGNPQVKGRGFAITGLILGFVWLIGLGIFGAAGGWFYQKSEVYAVLSRSVAHDVADNKLDAALKNTAGMTKADLQQVHDGIAAWGTLGEISLFERRLKNVNGVNTWEMSGTADFGNAGSKVVDFVLGEQGDGSYKVTGMHFK